MTKSLVFSAVLAGFCVGINQAEDWPQWGGPNRDHVSTEKDLLQSWPEGGPKQLWVSRVGGLGYSGFSVAQGRIYTMGAREGVEFLIALNANDGTELWATEIGRILKNNWGDGPRGTPTVANGKIYALGGQGTLIAVDQATGKLAWKATMENLGGKLPKWGYTESVLVENGVVYCTPGGDKGAVAALDAASGKVKWQSANFTEEAHYSSIMPAAINGKHQLVQRTEKQVVGIDPANGKVLWQTDFPGSVAVIPSPVVKGNNVYVTAGYSAGCKMVRITPQNKVEEVYSNKVMVNHHGGVVLVADHIYGYSDGKGWVCQNFASGDQVWASKELGKGAVTYADGRLYCLEEGKGTVVLAEASTNGWKEHGRFNLTPQSEQRSRQGRIWTHPVIANGRMYLRDQEILIAYDISATKPVASVPR